MITKTGFLRRALIQFAHDVHEADDAVLLVLGEELDLVAIHHHHVAALDDDVVEVALLGEGGRRRADHRHLAADEWRRRDHLDHDTLPQRLETAKKLFS